MSKNRIERERKFLVETEPKRLSKFDHNEIQQGYLARTSEKIEIRIRKKGRVHTITIKKGKGTARFEKEIPITARDFKGLWPLTKGKRIKKVRYNIPYQKHKIELDIYQGQLRNLKTAEVEFKNSMEMKKFKSPEWFDKEITGNRRYSNWNLARSGLRRTRAGWRK
jgi:adenylate cyclase